MVKKPVLTEQQRTELLCFSDLIIQKNRMYTSADISKLYDMHNGIFNSAKRPNGCPSCLRSTIRELANILKGLE